MSAEEVSLSSNPTALLFYSVLRGDTAPVEAALNAGASAKEPEVKYWDIAENLADEENVQMFASFFSPKWAQLTHSPLIAPPRPPLYFAIKREHYDIALLLLDRGANPNWTAPPRHKETGDSFALLPLAVNGGDLRLVSALLRAGADVNLATVKGMTALRVAVKIGSKEIVRLLLCAGADAGFVSPKGVTLLMEAAGHGFAGFDLDSRLPSEGTLGAASPTPPRVEKDDASPEDYAEIARLLLQHGANVHAVVPPGEKKHDLLAGTTALQAAANAHDTKMVRLLLDAGADPNAGGGMHGTPLIAAIGRENAEMRDMVCLLHERGANVNGATEDGGTALMAAAATGQADLIPVLLTWGADLHARRPLKTHDSGGYDALVDAVRAGHADCVASLLDAGAERDARYTLGRDALMLAAYWRRANIVRLLLERGADPTRQSDDAKTARDWAQTPTRFSQAAGKLINQWGTTAEQVTENVARKMKADFLQMGGDKLPEKMAAEVLPEPTAMLTNIVQTMQATTNERLRREAENQAEILALLPALNLPN